MGFLTNLGRTLSGVPPQGEGDRAAPASPDMDQFHDEGGRKIVPRVAINRVEPHLSGDRLELWVEFDNQSDLEIELRRMETLGAHLDLRQFLKPRERREYKVYAGQIPTTDAYHDAVLYYRTTGNDDLFQMRFLVEFDYRDGKYVPKDFEEHEPPRDI